MNILVTRQCKNDKRMPNNIKEKCDEFIRSEADTCTCTEKMDCNQLGRLQDLMRVQEAKAQTTAEDGQPRPGKLKPKKTKIWDEL